MTAEVDLIVEKEADAGEASLYRMVTDEHVCPFGLKAKDLLERKGYSVTDHHLETRSQQEAFKEKHQVETTPQIFIEGERVGGYDDLRSHFGLRVKDADATTYQPVVAIFAMAALMAVATSWAAAENLMTILTGERFIAISMCLLAVQKLRDLDGFSNGFLGYDLLAQRAVRYAYVYPFVEALAGVLMLAGALIWLAAPAALFIGSVGAVSVIKAVYIDKREIRCACVGGGSNVPLGFISLTENVMMVVIAVWMMVQ